MSETRAWRSTTSGRRRDRQGDHGRWLRLVVAATLAAAVAGCAIPFGPGGEDSPSRTGRDQNRIYLEEQERVERQRQTFEPTTSER